LGELYAQALRAKGFTVKIKSNIGSSEIIDKALTSGKLDFYPEYTGVILSELAHEKQRPANPDEAYAAAKKFEEGRGYTMLDKTLATGKIDAADVFTTDGALQGGKYKILKDPKFIFGFQNVSPIVSQKVLDAQGPEFAATLNAVSAKLTTEAMQKMNAAVDLD